jgi:hypothetical protein
VVENTRSLGVIITPATKYMVFREKDACVNAKTGDDVQVAYEAFLVDARQAISSK